jgi:hypothetical protein
MADKKVTYPRIETIYSTRICISTEEYWSVGPCGDDVDEDDAKAGKVRVAAPCGDVTAISKKEYIELRKAIDAFFGIK